MYTFEFVNLNMKNMKKLGLLLAAIVLSNVSFGQENTLKFQADIANRNGDVLFIKNNAVIVKEMKVQGNGHFEASFEVKEGMYQLYDGKEYTDLFLKNGYDLSLKMDAQKFDESIKYSGKGAAENNYLAEKVLIDGAFNYDALLELSTEDFNKKINDKQNLAVSKLEKGGYEANFIALQKKRCNKNCFK